MRYVLKERLFSLRDSYYIRGENGEDAFEVTGHLVSLRDKLSLRDLNGNDLATMTKKLLALRPIYTISRPDLPDAKVKKDFINIMREGFSVDMEGGLPDLRIQGDILDHNYNITRDGALVAQVSKKWVSLRDSYTVDVGTGEDAVLLLACAIVVDRIVHGGEDDEEKE
ncbi:MAG: LURP-one-related family protein [Caldilineaceae bacterium]|nr:LURP-one-related family protein [Caldilineaceae bacterium]